MVNPAFHCPYNVAVRGKDYQIQFEVLSNNQQVGVAVSGTWASVTYQETVDSTRIRDGVAMEGYKALKTIDLALWKNAGSLLTAVRLQAKVVCWSVASLVPAAAPAVPRAVPAAAAVPAVEAPLVTGFLGSDENPVAGFVVVEPARRVPAVPKGPDDEMMGLLEQVICSVFHKQPVTLRELTAQPARMPRIHPSGSLCFLKAVKHLRNPKQA